jgi:hypothetical protein
LTSSTATMRAAAAAECPPQQTTKSKASPKLSQARKAINFPRLFCW